MPPDETISVLLVDDDEVFARVLGRELERKGFEVRTATSGEQALSEFGANPSDAVLLDLRLGEMDGLQVLEGLRSHPQAPEVVILTGHGTIDTAIEAMKRGAADYVQKPCPIEELVVRLRRAVSQRNMARRVAVLERGLRPVATGLVAESPRMREVLDLALRVATSNVPVLILGETGVGKEVLARMIHARSPRAEGPFVVVDGGSIPDALLPSELFGHERGAFTGADRAKPGLFEVASGGTLFLDEVGELSPANQTALLRVLDTGTFRRIGGLREIQADARLVFATNRDIGAMVRRGHFRRDLYFRIAAVTIEVPPLRHRREDIEALVRHWLAGFSERFGSMRRIHEEAMEVLRRYSWPGNVRELFHAIEAALAVCQGDEIRPEDLPARVRGLPLDLDDPESDFPTLEALERRHIRRALARAHGNRAEAARLLGISERTLYRKIAEIGFEEGDAEGC